MGVFAEFERARITERVEAGIARARKRGTKSGKPFGRPQTSQRKIEAIKAELTKGTGALKTARLCSSGVNLPAPYSFAHGLLADAEIGRHFDGPLTGTNAASDQQSTVRSGARVLVDVQMRQPRASHASRRGLNMR